MRVQGAGFRVQGVGWTWDDTGVARGCPVPHGSDALARPCSGERAHRSYSALPVRWRSVPSSVPRRPRPSRGGPVRPEAGWCAALSTGAPRSSLSAKAPSSTVGSGLSPSPGTPVQGYLSPSAPARSRSGAGFPGLRAASSCGWVFLRGTRGELVRGWCRRVTPSLVAVDGQWHCSGRPHGCRWCRGRVGDVAVKFLMSEVPL